MTDKQENRLNMYDVVIAYMNANIAIWTGNVAITTIMSTLTTLVAEARTIGTGQQDTTKGATTDKANAKSTLATILSEILGPPKAYAKSTNNQTLFSRLNFTYSGIYYLRDEQVPITVQAIITTLNTLTANPASGVLPADVTTVQTLLANYVAASDVPRTIEVGTSTFTKLLEPKQQEIDTLLRDQLDNQMLRYRTSHPQFYLGYQGARVIIDN